jgi:outer membrane protein TolC
MRLEDVMFSVLQYHPLVLQTNAQISQADAKKLTAMGRFDPALSYQLDEKSFKSKNYYTTVESYVKVPTRFGLDFKAGFESVTGGQVNPENITPAAGLAVAGVSIPVGRDLLIDERRAQLRQARLAQSLAAIEQRKTLNKLLLSVTKDYLEWYFAQEKRNLMKEAYDLAYQRFLGVKNRVEAGDLASLDTIEASLAVQSRLINYQMAELELINARLSISKHLWGPKNQALWLDTNVLAQNPSISVWLSASDKSSLIASLSNQHPELLKLNNKIKQLEIDRKLAVNNLLPSIQLQANAIQSWSPDASMFDPAMLSSNYKLGLSVYMPLFLRKERGKLRTVDAKTRFVSLDFIETKREQEIAIETAWNERNMYQQMLGNQQVLVGKLRQMRDGEQERFNQGESTFFLINTREMSLIDGQVKQLDSELKVVKANAFVWYESGTLYDKIKSILNSTN